MIWRRCACADYVFDEATAALGGDMLQATLWAEHKYRFGWRVERVWHISRGGVDATAQVLLRRLGRGVQVGYVPRGPAGVRGEGSGGSSPSSRGARAGRPAA